MDPLREWHDFYLLAGTAAGTLIGLMFVAASIGASYFTPERSAGMQAFLTPTVVHFSSVLVGCLLTAAPWSSPVPLAALLVAGGAGGFAYAVTVRVRMARRGLHATIDLADRIWYAVAPVFGYSLIVAAAGMLLAGSAASLEVLAAAVLLLLLVGIRNAWDMAVWSIMHSGGG